MNRDTMNSSFGNPVQDNTVQKAQSAFLSRVYGWMVGGLLLTAVTAWWVTTSVEVMNAVYSYMAQ